MNIQKLEIDQVWRNDWFHPLSNAWNGKIVDIKKGYLFDVLLVDEWVGDRDKPLDTTRTEWLEPNFRVFYVRLLNE